MREKYKYIHGKQDYEIPPNSGDYEMLNCGCHRQPVDASKKHLARCVCRLHGGTMITGILKTKDVHLSLLPCKPQTTMTPNTSEDRFRNTLRDLKEAYDYLDVSEEDLGAEEAPARNELVQLCKDIGEVFGDE